MVSIPAALLRFSDLKAVSNSSVVQSESLKNAKHSGYYFYTNSNIWGDFQICISVPLT